MSAFFVPEPRLEEVHNRTPFAEFQCDKMGVGRRFFDTVVVKGTFLLAPGSLTLAPEQEGPALNDEVWDAQVAERSSLRRAGDVVLFKPRTDVLVTGTARVDAPRAEWDVRVAVTRGDRALVDRRFHVTGPRRWVRRDGEWSLAAPEPVSEVPLRYELAYGGAYPDPEDASAPWTVYRANPSGTGFVDPRGSDDVDIAAPQWLEPGMELTTPERELPLAGFGPVARPWESRLGFAGTYDEAWKRRAREETARGIPPDYAADFDPRFFQCAHPDLIAEPLRGDEVITLEGLTPGSPLRMRLPSQRVVAHLLDGQGAAEIEAMRLDTVHVDLDAARVFVCWRLTLDQARDVRAAVVVSEEVS